MGVKQIASGLDRIIEPVKKLLLIIASAVLALMMLLTALDVGMRYILNAPIPGALELVEYMMAILVPFAVAVMAYAKGHIGVDLFIERFPDWLQTVVGCLTTLLTTALYAVLTWQCALYVGEEFHSEVTSAVLLIPQYPFIAALLAAFALLTLITLMHFFEYLSKVIAQWTH